MKQKHSTYWKAFFLLLVFSMNTVVSFACSLGGVFHQFHHQGAASFHQHKEGHSHQHASGHKHDHKHGHKHQHADPSEKKTGDDCCSGDVVKLEKADKATTAAIKVPAPAIEEIFLDSFTYYLSQVQAPRTALPRFYRWRPPGTIQDLRIAIQSFQI
ncbi:MAG: hypothetical protein EOO15_23555 [Chitinophagaceae bacterium]|nr:MAG: hypothetical protein EOO15_23555 [Chitinophagaceae bacterium]